MVPRNTCDAVDQPRVPKRPMKTFTLEQAFRFLKEAEQDQVSALCTFWLSLLAYAWVNCWRFNGRTSTLMLGLFPFSVEWLG